MSEETEKTTAEESNKKPQNKIEAFNRIILLLAKYRSIAAELSSEFLDTDLGNMYFLCLNELLECLEFFPDIKRAYGIENKLDEIKSLQNEYNEYFSQSKIQNSAGNRIRLKGKVMDFADGISLKFDRWYSLFIGETQYPDKERVLGLEESEKAYDEIMDYYREKSKKVLSRIPESVLRCLRDSDFAKEEDRFRIGKIGDLRYFVRGLRYETPPSYVMIFTNKGLFEFTVNEDLGVLRYRYTGLEKKYSENYIVDMPIGEDNSKEKVGYSTYINGDQWSTWYAVTEEGPYVYADDMMCYYKSKDEILYNIDPGSGHLKPPGQVKVGEEKKVYTLHPTWYNNYRGNYIDAESNKLVDLNFPDIDKRLEPGIRGNIKGIIPADVLEAYSTIYPGMADLISYYGRYSKKYVDSVEKPVSDIYSGKDRFNEAFGKW